MFMVASNAGVLREARFSSLPTKTSSPKNACVGSNVYGSAYHKELSVQFQNIDITLNEKK